MRRLLVGILAAAILLLVPASASAVEYSTDVACGVTAAAPPSRVCEIDDDIGAFFEADEDTEYEVCVEFPDGSFPCTPLLFAEANVLDVVEIVTDELGEHVATWWVGDELVGLWGFDVVAPPKPPPPPPPPPAPPVLPAPPQSKPLVTPACVKARGTVTRLKARLRKLRAKKASTPKQKTQLAGKLRKAKAAVKRAC
ncbi:MAG TPA: hypothetical protein VEQ41_04005 [Solirubrobacterales bacterium]|nr:hypothetical protein [Solirubrobacterales bacterium]